MKVWEMHRWSCWEPPDWELGTHMPWMKIESDRDYQPQDNYTLKNHNNPLCFSSATRFWSFVQQRRMLPSIKPLENGGPGTLHWKPCQRADLELHRVNALYNPPFPFVCGLRIDEDLDNYKMFFEQYYISAGLN